MVGVKHRISSSRLKLQHSGKLEILMGMQRILAATKAIGLGAGS